MNVDCRMETDDSTPGDVLTVWGRLIKGERRCVHCRMEDSQPDTPDTIVIDGWQRRSGLDVDITPRERRAAEAAMLESIFAAEGAL